MSSSSEQRRPRKWFEGLVVCERARTVSRERGAGSGGLTAANICDAKSAADKTNKDFGTDKRTKTEGQADRGTDRQTGRH